MAENDKFADEMLTDEQLEGVAGGSKLETIVDGGELWSRGLLPDYAIFFSDLVEAKMHELGYTGYQANGGLLTKNVYTDKNGNRIDGKTLWANFDAENGTKIIHEIKDAKFDFLKK